MSMLCKFITFNSLCFRLPVQIIKPAVADAAGQATYAADRITGEAIMPLAQAVADQVLDGTLLTARTLPGARTRPVLCISLQQFVSMCRATGEATTLYKFALVLISVSWSCWQAEPTAEMVKERYVAPLAAIAKEQVLVIHCRPGSCAICVVCLHGQLPYLLVQHELRSALAAVGIVIGSEAQGAIMNSGFDKMPAGAGPRGGYPPAWRLPAGLRLHVWFSLHSLL